MKKLLAVVLAVAVIGTLAACGGAEPAPAPAGSGSSSAEPSVNIGMEAVYGPNHDQYWSDYDEIIKKIKTTADTQERAGYMYEAEEWIKDTWTILPLYYYTNPYLCSTSLKDYIYSPLGWVNYQYAYMDNGADNITVNFSSDPETMDPALNSSVDGSVMLTNAFAGLYGFDVDLNIIPNCAEEVVAPTALDGGKYQYVIKLKDGLKWSDGVDMKASDFEYSWKRAADPATAADYQYMFDVIDGYSDDETCNLNVTADDEAGTITIVTGSYCAYFDQLMAFPTYFPVRKDIVEGNDSWATSPATYVSNGPFKMADWTVGSEIVFEKNPYFWDADNTKLNKVTFFLSNDDDAIFANFTNGTIQYTTTVPVSQIPVMKADPNRMNVDFFIGDYIGTYFLEINVNWSFKPGLAVASDSPEAWTDWTPEQNAEVRHALGLLIDRNYIVEQVTGAGQAPATGFVPAGMDDGTGTEFRSQAPQWWSVDAADYEANKAEAVAILDKYYTKGEDGKYTDFPKFEYSANPTSGNLAICAGIQDMWDDYGIAVEVDQRDWAVIQTALTAGDFTLSRLGWIADYNDPVNFLEILLSASGNNHPHLGKAQGN